MINIRKSHERGHANHGWLDSHFTFSFADYLDPEHVQFRTLRVMNDDRVAGGGGFPKHPHRDMEIVTYVLEGALEHKDSMGNGSVIKPGDVQYMSAGTGVAHSEFNASSSEPVHLYQIWMLPEKHGLKPAYDQKNFSAAEKRGKLRLVASPDGREGSVKIRQDNELYATILGAGEMEARTSKRSTRLRAGGPGQREAERDETGYRRRCGHLCGESPGTYRSRRRRGAAVRSRVMHASD
jgi:redox-sensitive bicupin YhaK (pirin superfamily)